MNVLKSTLAALFVGEVGYAIAVVIFLFVSVGVSTQSATGIGALLSVATSPLVILIGVICFLLALWLFLRF